VRMARSLSRASAMSVVPLDVQRRFERRWAGRFHVTPLPKLVEPSRDGRTKHTDTGRQQPSQDKKARLPHRRVPC
jgi:hypothetical protein